MHTLSKKYSDTDWLWPQKVCAIDFEAHYILIGRNMSEKFQIPLSQMVTLSSSSSAVLFQQKYHSYVGYFRYYMQSQPRLEIPSTISKNQFE